MALAGSSRGHRLIHARRQAHDGFLAEFGLQESDFPKTPQDLKKPGPYMGEGVYLGMPSKFTVLLLQKKSSGLPVVGVRTNRAFLGDVFQHRAVHHQFAAQRVT